MAKQNITRTYGPIHFEDLDPHRFEDLVREIIYDYREWQSIEATGRSGSDEGFDIRAYEKVSNYYKSNDDHELDDSYTPHVMDGNLWMIQCKRESVVGPQKISKIIEECIKSDDPPYGYILVAPANFSKKAYDIFRDELKSRGVMEFYLWGKGELEDRLHMPKYDRILFTFFGISLLMKQRKRSVQVRAGVSVKNKLFKILGKEFRPPYQRLLIRDINDIEYPDREAYNDFEIKPRWLDTCFRDYHSKGICVDIARYYGYFDVNKNEWDYSPFVNKNVLQNMDITQDDLIHYRKKEETVRKFWETLPEDKQVYITLLGLLCYEDVLLLDEEGDMDNPFLHIYVDISAYNGLFNQVAHVVGKNSEDFSIEDKKSNRISIFPSFPDSL